MREAFHPRSMLIYLLSLFFLALLYDDPCLLAAMLMGLALINLGLDRAKSWRKMLIYALPLMLLIMIINLLISRQGQVLWERDIMGIHLAVHRLALLYGFTMTLRLLVILSVFTAFNLLLSLEELLELFPARRGTAVMVAAITARMVPELMQRVRGIREIQLVRCGDAGESKLIERCRRTGILVINVLRAALNGAWETGEVMQVRGFGAAEFRSTYRQHSWRMRDNWLALASLSALVLALMFNWLLNDIHNLWGGIVPLFLLGTAWLTVPQARISQPGQIDAGGEPRYF